jgi:ribose 1,5-bisphosphokinase PhnN
MHYSTVTHATLTARVERLRARLRAAPRHARAEIREQLDHAKAVRYAVRAEVQP